MLYQICFEEVFGLFIFELYFAFLKPFLSSFNYRKTPIIRIYGDQDKIVNKKFGLLVSQGCSLI